MLNEPYEEPEDLLRTPAYMLDTNTSLDALRPSVSVTTVVDENERVVDFAGAADKMLLNWYLMRKLYIQDISKITANYEADSLGCASA